MASRRLLLLSLDLALNPLWLAGALSNGTSLHLYSTYKHESIQIAVMISLTRSMDENIIYNTFYIKKTL